MRTNQTQAGSSRYLLLNGRKTLDKHNATLIEWGFRLVTYHKTNLEPAERPL